MATKNKAMCFGERITSSMIYASWVAVGGGTIYEALASLIRHAGNPTSEVAAFAIGGAAFAVGIVTFAVGTEGLTHILRK